MLVAESDPKEPGLFTSVGNGFISANVGCATNGQSPSPLTLTFTIHASSSPSPSPSPSTLTLTLTAGHGNAVTEFFLHVGGVFCNQIRIHPRGAVSIPHRAGIPNPFAAVATIMGSANLQAGTALDMQYGLFSNATAAKGSSSGSEVRVTTTVYAHRALRSLLVFEVTADFGTGRTGEDDEAADASVTVGLERCGGGSIKWDKLPDFNVTSDVNSPQEGGQARTLVVKYMEENCDSGHFCPRDVPLHNCPSQGGRCNNTAMPQPRNTEVGIAFEPLPSTLTLTPAQPTRKFIAAVHTSLEPGLGAPGAAATAAAATLAKYGGDKSTSASLRSSHEAAWAAQWQGGIEVAGNLTIASTVNASLYYILSATRPDWPYGLSPGGLARDDYEGHSFWDCETWCVLLFSGYYSTFLLFSGLIIFVEALTN